MAVKVSTSTAGDVLFAFSRYGQQASLKKSAGSFASRGVLIACHTHPDAPKRKIRRH
jgi:hypothetical protein